MDVPYVVLKSTKYEITNSIEQMNWGTNNVQILSYISQSNEA